MKIPNKKELQQIPLNHLSDIDFKDFINIYKKFTIEPYFFWLMIQLYHHTILEDLEKKNLKQIYNKS